MRKTFKLIATSDVHGMLFPYDFTTLSPAPGSLARVASYVKCVRERYGDDHVLLLDNGDMLQGQPPVYYYNFEATDVTHPVAEMMKAMGYDAQTIGNHDLEGGHDVYDRYRSDLQPIPLLGANVEEAATGEPYFAPYAIVNRGGVRFAIIGLLTPAIPAWLPEKLWSGLRVTDMVESARKWVEYVRAHEHPDMIVGLFHSGYESTHLTGKWLENESALVAREVEGFDLIFMGHDHLRAVRRESSGVLLLNPGAHARLVAEATVNVDIAPDGRVAILDVDTDLINIEGCEPDPEFMDRFRPNMQETCDFVSRIIGRAAGDFSGRDAYFGPSAFMELIHRLQIEVSGADISIASPTSFDPILRKGPLRVSDMFTLYRYENQLCTISMSGREIKDHLEMSHNLWTAIMHSPDDHLLKFSTGNHIKGDYTRLINPTYNFDSAYGIDYEVDVTQPQGRKIRILSMSDGRPFDLNGRYRVALNTYRANGGGELLTRGAGIPSDRLHDRVLSCTSLDLRHYLMKYIECEKVITPSVTPNWKFVPEALVAEAKIRDRHLLFHHHPDTPSE